MDRANLTADQKFGLRLDLFERITLCLLLGWAWVRFLPVGTAPANITLLVSEGLVVLFVLFRRPTSDITRRPLDWLVALIGTAAPLLTMPATGNGLLPAGVSTVLMLIGLVLHVSAKLILRRSFGVVAANRGIKVSGPYKLVRHPIYAGYFYVHLGFLLAAPSVWNICLLGIGLTANLWRIRMEEHLLMNDAAYRSLAVTTPYRLLPFIY